MRTRSLGALGLMVFLLHGSVAEEASAAGVKSAQVACNLSKKGKAKIDENVAVLPIQEGQRVNFYMNFGNARANKGGKITGEVLVNCQNGFFSSKINKKYKRGGVTNFVLGTGLDTNTCGEQVAITADVKIKGKKNGLDCGEAPCNFVIGAAVREVGVCIPSDPTGESGFCSSDAQCCSGLCLPPGDACDPDPDLGFCAPLCQPADDF